MTVGNEERVPCRSLVVSSLWLYCSRLTSRGSMSARSPGRGQRQSFIFFGCEALAPSSTSRFGKVGKRARVNPQALEAHAQSPARRGRETIPRAPCVDQSRAVVVTKDDCVEVLASERIPGDDEFLGPINPHLLPGAGSLAWVMATVAPLCNEAFKTLCFRLHLRFPRPGRRNLRQPALFPCSAEVRLRRRVLRAWSWRRSDHADRKRNRASPNDEPVQLRRYSLMISRVNVKVPVEPEKEMLCTAVIVAEPRRKEPTLRSAEQPRQRFRCFVGFSC
jgi:hypothetical protein